LPVKASRGPGLVFDQVPRVTQRPESAESLPHGELQCLRKLHSQAAAVMVKAEQPPPAMAVLELAATVHSFAGLSVELLDALLLE
jgi:hypothetical protein